MNQLGLNFQKFVGIADRFHISPILPVPQTLHVYMIFYFRKGSLEGWWELSDLGRGRIKTTEQFGGNMSQEAMTLSVRMDYLDTTNRFARPPQAGNVLVQSTSKRKTVTFYCHEVLLSWRAKSSVK